MDDDGNDLLPGKVTLPTRPSFQLPFKVLGGRAIFYDDIV